MAKKLDTTPDGIRCMKCGQDYPPYYFFSPRGKYNKTFFASGIPLSHVCWYCAAPYRCVQCGEIREASEFRVMGRICNHCKTSTMASRTSSLPMENGETPTLPMDSHNSAKTLENGGDE